MPVKQKPKRVYHKGHHKEKHTKRFVKVYAPYLPLAFIVAIGMFISGYGEFRQLRSHVLAYATNMTDNGLLDATNSQREKEGLPSLSYSQRLDEAAQAKAEDMAARNYWSHNTPEGKEPWIFIDNAGYSYYKAAENLAYGFTTSNGAVNGWMNSPGHRANILDGQLKEVGFGIVNVANYQGKGPETVVVAMYGTPSVASATSDKQSIPLPLFESPKQQASDISYVASASSTLSPWTSFILGLIAGLGAMFVAFKHIHGIGKMIRRGERFVLHHPLFDLTVLAAVALAALLLQTAGVIQ